MKTTEREVLAILPVVMMADLIEAGDQFGWNDFTYAAAPLTCGHDMEVPDMNVKSEYWVSPFNPVRDLRRVYDAKMSIPGAEISGCIFRYREGKPVKQFALFSLLQKRNMEIILTLRRRWLPGFGPLDENEAANGA